MTDMTREEYRELSKSISDIKSDLSRLRYLLESDSSTKKIGAIEQISIAIEQISTLDDRLMTLETKIKMRDFKIAVYVGVLVTIFSAVGWFAEKIWRIFVDK